MSTEEMLRVKSSIEVVKKTTMTIINQIIRRIDSKIDSDIKGMKIMMAIKEEIGAAEDTGTNLIKLIHNPISENTILTTYFSTKLS